MIAGMIAEMGDHKFFDNAIKYGEVMQEEPTRIFRIISIPVAFIDFTKEDVEHMAREMGLNVSD